MAFYGVGIDSEVTRIIGDIKLKLSNRFGSYGLRQLDLALKRAASSFGQGVGLLPEDFIQTLKDLGIFLKQIEEQALRKFFLCKTNSGVIDHTAFVDRFREKLTPQREKIVRALFERIDVNNNGAIEPQELSKFYKSNYNTDFVLGRKPESQAVEEFMSLFDTNHDGKVSYQEWHTYYIDVSSITHSDKAFEELLQSCWGPVQKEAELLKEHANHFINLIRERLVTLTKGAEDEFKLQKLFQSFDKHNSGLLSLFEFDGMLLKLNIVVPKETLPLLFKSLDKNSSGYIEFDEFCNFLLYNPYKR